MEYCSTVWSPVYEVHIKHLESVQRKFLKFLCFIIDGTYPERGYNHSLLLRRFNMNSLQTRRNMFSVCFLYKLLNNQVDCSLLLEKINFVVPRSNKRQTVTFYCDACRTNLLRRSPLFVMCNNYNKICSKCDIYFDSVKTIKKVIELTQ